MRLMSGVCIGELMKSLCLGSWPWQRFLHVKLQVCRNKTDQENNIQSGHFSPNDFLVGRKIPGVVCLNAVRVPLGRLVSLVQYAAW
jgi:hypothetical protein